MAEESKRSLANNGLDNLPAYEPALRHYFRKRVPAHEVDDLVQEVFINLHSRRANTVVEDPERYLFTVAAHALHRKMAGDSRWVPLDQQQLDDSQDQATPERIVLSREELDKAIDIISHLPPRTRQIFVLHRFEEMTYRRIGKELGISVSAVEKHIISALRTLNSYMERK